MVKMLFQMHAQMTINQPICKHEHKIDKIPNAFQPSNEHLQRSFKIYKNTK